MHTTIGLTTCTAIILTAITLLSPPRPTPANILERIEKTRTLTLSMHAPDDKTPPWQIQIKDQTLLRCVITKPESIISIINRVTGKYVFLHPDKKRAETGYEPTSPFDLYAWFKDLKDNTQKPAGEKTLNGKHVISYKISCKMPDPFQPDLKPVPVTVWIDPATQLPVQVETLNANQPVIFDNLQFDTPLDDSLFDMTIPKGYKIIDAGGLPPDQLKPASPQLAAQLILTPNVGLGPLHFGAPRKDILQLLGSPDPISNDHELNYTAKGLIFYLDRKTKTLFSIRAVASRTMQAQIDFPGKTDKAITINSTRAQIEAAYGKPTHNPFPGDLEYDNGLKFFLAQDHVTQIDLTQPQPNK